MESKNSVVGSITALAFSFVKQSKEEECKDLGISSPACAHAPVSIKLHKSAKETSVPVIDVMRE